MIRLSINLPTGRRLHLRLVKRRKNGLTKSLLPDLGEIRRARRGSRISRYFTHIFENKNIRRFLGANMAIAIVATTLVPSTTSGFEAEQAIVSPETVLTTTPGEIRYPVDYVSITQGYKLFHPGIDLDGVTGDPVYPVMAGVVEGVSYSNYGYGTAVLVGHKDGITSLYAHLSKMFVKAGDSVGTDSVIGLMGATGHAYGDHLHLEIRDHGQPVNPLNILSE